MLRENLKNLIEGTKIPGLYGLEEASIILNIPKGTLYDMSYRNKLPCTKIGKRIQLTEEHIQQIISNGCKYYDSEPRRKSSDFIKIATLSSGCKWLRKLDFTKRTGKRSEPCEPVSDARSAR